MLHNPIAIGQFLVTNADGRARPRCRNLGCAQVGKQFRAGIRDLVQQRIAALYVNPTLL
jgi:hypothetical protein